MISREDDPVRFSGLVDELSDAEEHLHELLDNVVNDPEYDEDCFRVDLGHVYAHLNRAWHMRGCRDSGPELDRDVISKFPIDLEPVG